MAHQFFLQERRSKGEGAKGSVKPQDTGPVCVTLCSEAASSSPALKYPNLFPWRQEQGLCSPPPLWLVKGSGQQNSFIGASLVTL